MSIINVMERMVDDKMERYMDKYDGCMCQVCLDDIKCLSLNNLPPKYVNTLQGELFSRVEQIMLRQNCVDLDISVMNAIELVKKKPRCKEDNA